jgi:hypothetical protein
MAACRQARRRRQQDRVPLASLQRAGDDDDGVGGAEPPLAPHRLARRRRHRQTVHLDTARHDPDTLGADSRPLECRPHAGRDGDHLIDRVIVEKAHVRAARRHVVHPPRDHEPGAAPATERCQRQSARGVEVDDVVTGHQPPEREPGAQVEVVADAQRRDRHAEGGGRRRQAPLRIGGQPGFVAAEAEGAEEGQDLRLATAPATLRVDVQDAHLRLPAPPPPPGTA